MKINIEYSRDNFLTESGKTILKDRYLLPTEASPQDAFARAAKTFADDQAHAQRLYDYASKLWFMFSTPVLSNGGTTRGLPISCFLNYVDDSREGLADHYTENIWLSSMGGGIGGYWGDVRSQGMATSIGNKTTGVIPFMHVVDSQMTAFHQGATRRGSYASYMDISHPEIIEFIEMRKPTGGDIHRKNLNLHHGVNVSDKFMEAVVAGDQWDLIDPHTKQVINTTDARTLWIKLLETRIATGEPYISFIDTVNEALPESQKKLGLKFNHSNLCSEITLPTAKDRTAVCCLSSVNLEYFDEWKDNPQFIEDLVRMLDNVLEHFIEKAPDYMWRAVNSARCERAIGLGSMGLHSYFQKRAISMDSPMSKSINEYIFKHIHKEAQAANKKLGAERGSPADMEGTGLRHSHVIAIAPNASSSVICGGTSPSIEPLRANAFSQKTLSGTFLMKNKYLEKTLLKYDRNNKEVWKSIVTNGGSVQHLSFLSEADKEVFKTAIEMNQRWLVDLAADRQKYICQSQSLNLFLPPDVDTKTLHGIHLRAWKNKVKTLYYMRSQALKKVENLSSKIERTIRQDFDTDETACAACEA
jgi:ribonucleoside-diphosphate reductase alpha chain|tara:strand:- start:1472 stop:3229 length:1758 start_codon:yes stop_codon:yes gene_type:complete